MKVFCIFSLLIGVSILASVQGQLGQCRLDAIRLDCYPEGSPTEVACQRRGCVYCPDEPSSIPDAPSCVLPQNFGYKLQSILYDQIEEGRGASFRLFWDGVQLYPGTVEHLILTVNFESNYRFRITIKDEDKERWEIPLEINSPTGSPNDNIRYSMTYNTVSSIDSPFWFRIFRKDDNTTIFDTQLGGMTFADQFLQISTYLGSKNLYGIGENEQMAFRHDMEQGYENVYPLYARDQAPQGHVNMYGVQPYYTVLEDAGKAHSIAILNSNAQEFLVLPSAIIYRTTGGILDILGFVGEHPEDTARYYTEAVGRFPIPPYWALGFHLCRYGYETLENMKEVVDRNLQYGIPHDVQYGDIDIMQDQMDFTIDEERFGGLPDYVHELKSKNVKFITILDPAIATNQENYPAFDIGEELGVWIVNSDGSPFVGKVWPGNQTWPVYFPDYSNPAAHTWWLDLIVEFHNLLAFDGLWIDMNEPANFVAGDWNKGCSVNKWNNPSYMPRIKGGHLAEKTICPDTKQFKSTHFDDHSLYGYYQTEPTYKAVQAATGKRGLTLSRSTFLGSGRWAAHWLGDNYSKWNNLHPSIIGTLQFNHFGIPFVGPDICGHFDDAWAELCNRWQQLGAFYPFSRNHNARYFVDQDPAAFGPEVAANSRKALLIRYELLPYLYTLFFQHFTQGSTVARPLWHLFNTDSETFGIDKQFMWGNGLLITPVMEDRAVQVEGYFPPSGRFYDYYSPTRDELLQKGVVTLNAPLDMIPLHFIGGSILMTQKPEITTSEARKNNFTMIIALDAEYSAAGEFFWDDGESQDTTQKGEYFLTKLEFLDGLFSNTIQVDGFPAGSIPLLTTMEVLGIPKKVANVVNMNTGDELDPSQIISTGTHLRLTTLDLDITQGVQLLITYRED